MKKGDRFHWVSKVCVSNRWNASAISSFDSTFRYAWDAEIKRAQSTSRRRRAAAILRLARGRASARARGDIPRHSSNCYRLIAVSNATGTAFVSSYAYDHLGRSMTTKPVVNWAEKPPIIEQKTVNEVKKKLKVKP